MVNSKEILKDYISYETREFTPKVLLKIPFDLYESQIIAKFIILLRKTEYHINCNHKIRKIFYLLALKHKQCKYGVHIPVNVFAKGLSIAHLGTIVVNGDAKVGSDCRIHVGVVIVLMVVGCLYWEIMFTLALVRRYLEKFTWQMGVKSVQMLL